MKNWKDISDQVPFPSGVRHGTAFKISEDIFRKLIENR
jgi:beta-galactosidase